MNMNLKDYKIVFLGTPDISAKLLEGLVEYGFNIPLVITQNDKKTGRNLKLEESDVSKMANKLNIEVFKPDKLNKDYQKLVDLKPDLLLTYAYGQILSTRVLELSRLKPLNFHASLLPKYRGASPIQHALLNGDKETGITLMEMEKGMDTGKIYACEKLDIKDDDNYTSLKNRLTDLAIEMSKNYLVKYLENNLVGTIQDENKATYTRMLTKEDEHLLIDSTCDEFINKVRAFSLTPGAYLLNGDEYIKIYKALKLTDQNLFNIGTLNKFQKKLVLQLKDGIIELCQVQKAGKKIMSGSDFLNGIKDIGNINLK